MSSSVKTGSLYIGMGLVLGAGLALILVLGSQIAPLRSGPVLTSQPINTVAWFGALPAVQIPGAPGQDQAANSSVAPSFTLYGTSLFTTSRWALIGPQGGGGESVAQAAPVNGMPVQDVPPSEVAQWVEEGGSIGEYRVAKITARDVVLNRSAGEGEWTLSLNSAQPEGGAVNNMDAAGGAVPGTPSPEAALETNTSGCHGAIKVPRMAMDVLNQQQAMLIRGLEVQGGGLRVKPELAALLGGLGFMAGDVLISSNAGQLNAPQTLTTFVIVPLLRGREVTIQGIRNGEERNWRLMSEASCR